MHVEDCNKPIERLKRSEEEQHKKYLCIMFGL